MITSALPPIKKGKIIMMRIERALTLVRDSSTNKPVALMDTTDNILSKTPTALISTLTDDLNSIHADIQNIDTKILQIEDQLQSAMPFVKLFTSDDIVDGKLTILNNEHNLSNFIIDKIERLDLENTYTNLNCTYKIKPNGDLIFIIGSPMEGRIQLSEKSINIQMSASLPIGWIGELSTPVEDAPIGFYPATGGIYKKNNPISKALLMLPTTLKEVWDIRETTDSTIIGDIFPAMTSATTPAPYKVVTVNSFSGYDGWKAFDKINTTDENTAFLSANGQVETILNFSIGDDSKSYYLYKYNIEASHFSTNLRNPDYWDLQLGISSDINTNDWVSVDIRSNQSKLWDYGQSRSFPINDSFNDTFIFRKLRFKFKKAPSDPYFRIGEIKFFVVDASLASDINLVVNTPNYYAITKTNPRPGLYPYIYLGAL